MIINTRPEEVSKKIIELCKQEKIESRHVHMSRIEFLSGSKKQCPSPVTKPSGWM